MEAPTPDLLPAFTMRIERAAPIVVGAIATGGARHHVPVASGTFEGEGLAGNLVGGGETLLERADGVTVIEASYYIAFTDGAVARCFGTGYRTGALTRLSLLFEAAEESSVAPLATRAFIAEQQEGSPTMTICRIV
ncbi:MAG: DUF3237 family protein [Sphingomonadales bacterium]|nr:DUF3237 family protein [Sphingomonadales bacterium]